ncbi:LptF/LptG family permease [Aphanizomenon flos-aquae NRERC-008]|uniref:Permease n=2 Tax=Aphanizomenon flos-aquae TaxID=1176 RepID=A0A1B7X053_APHFL|nr:MULTISPECIES: LptF/LptG family permease [Aphanizomenon]MCE2906273.1 LptF/LptG family permease [Anabaena sp. CoA2_C59]MDJ0507264.1 LptF/LptG family permease [Nostocales cyanobacterium LE14-WE12]OBQ20524.1 MAG: permease [Anabaena sp. WA113]OBQ42745.1 MAG: permease [Aphanizomenon flos-aquae WA102]QSV69071.1 MAG: YjgP/YjgQ family permease [Aphanizomenon flos-aquae DEX188]
MDRYLAMQLISPFLFGVGAFTSVVLAIDSLFELLRKVVESGLPLNIALEIFLLKLPYVMVYSFPMSTLLATLMTYSRLSGESELIALRGCGVSVYRMVLTAVVLSFGVTIMTYIFNEQIAPAANYQATITLEQALKSDKPSLKQQNIYYPEYREFQEENGSKNKILSRLFYADQFDGKAMKGLTIIDRSRSGVDQIVVSESAKWNSKQQVWDFYNGTIYLVATDRSYRNILRFEHQQLQLPRTPLTLAENSRDYGEMNISQALEQLEIERLGGNDQKIRKLQVRIQQKIAFPFVCVIFGLVGSVMGSIPQRTGRGKSFGISVIVIFSYYLLLSVSGALAQAGIFSPFIGAWLPNLFGLGIGLFLLIRVAQK